MKRIMCIFLSFCSSALAANGEKGPTGLPRKKPATEYYEHEPPTSKLFNIDVGLTAYYRDYKEKLPSPKKSEERGVLTGFYGSFEYDPGKAFYAQIYGDWNQGRTIYDGSLQDNSGNFAGYASGHTDNKLYDIFAKFGFTIPIDSSVSVTPFVGYGLHEWQRLNIGCAGNTSGSCYSEIYSWNYFLFGLRVPINVSPVWQLVPMVQVMQMSEGEIELEGLNFSDNVGKLGNKIHYYVNVRSAFFFEKNLSVTATPFFTSRPIGQGDNNATGTIGITWSEPASTTYTYGLNVGLMLVF